MKCTLISGPEGFGKSEIASLIEGTFEREETAIFENVPVPFDFEEFTSFIQLVVSPRTRLILVRTMEGPIILKHWLKLAHQRYLSIDYSGESQLEIRPHFVLIYKTKMPINAMLTKTQLLSVKVVDLYGNAFRSRMHN